MRFRRWGSACWHFAASTAGAVSAKLQQWEQEAEKEKDSVMWQGVSAIFFWLCGLNAAGWGLMCLIKHNKAESHVLETGIVAVVSLAICIIAGLTYLGFAFHHRLERMEATLQELRNRRM